VAFSTGTAPNPGELPTAVSIELVASDGSPERRRIFLALRQVAACCLLVLLVPLVGCGGGSLQPKTELTILAVNKSVGRAIFHLDCGPTGGDLPDNGRARRALSSEPTLVTDPKPFLCPAMPWQVAISGRLDGRRINRTFVTCWTPQMATIGQLGIGKPLVLRAHLV